MRVASFNLMHGRSLTDGLVDAGRLRGAVRALGADVLALQEVDRGQPRSGHLDLTAVVAETMGAADGDWRFCPAVYGTPGEQWWPVPPSPSSVDDAVPEVAAAPVAAGPVAAAPVRPEYGIGLVSRLPVLEWRVIRLASAPVRSPVAVPGGRRGVRLILLEDEPRIGLAAVIKAPFGTMTAVSTHLSFVPGWNVVQLRRLVDGLAGLPEPFLMLGDLNLPGRVAALASGWRSLARTPTYPSTGPRVQLDHVLGRGPLPAVTAVRAQRTAISDHCALVVDLDDDLPPAPAPA